MGLELLKSLTEYWEERNRLKNIINEVECITIIDSKKELEKRRIPVDAKSIMTYDELFPDKIPTAHEVLGRDR